MLGQSPSYNNPLNYHERPKIKHRPRLCPSALIFSSTASGHQRLYSQTAVVPCFNTHIPTKTIRRQKAQHSITKRENRIFRLTQEDRSSFIYIPHHRHPPCYTKNHQTLRKCLSKLWRIPLRRNIPQRYSHQECKRQPNDPNLGRLPLTTSNYRLPLCRRRQGKTTSRNAR